MWQRLLGAFFKFIRVEVSATTIDHAINFFSQLKEAASNDFQWSESHYGDRLDSDEDDNSLFLTPGEDVLDDDSGEAAFDAPLDTEGEGDVETSDGYSLSEESTEAATGDAQEGDEQSDEDEESDTEEENEEASEDEEDYEDVSDTQGDVEFGIDQAESDPDEDLDYLEEEFEEESTLDDQAQGGYDLESEDYANVTQMFEMFADDGADTDNADDGEESSELEEDNLFTGDRLYDSATDTQDDLLDFVTDDAALLPFDAALLVGDTELFDNAAGWFEDMMGDALANNFAGEGI